MCILYNKNNRKIDNVKSKQFHTWDSKSVVTIYYIPTKLFQLKHIGGIEGSQIHRFLYYGIADCL